MPNGTVKFFNPAKGFGFITADEGGKDHFVPATSLVTAGLPSLKMGQRVSFDAKPDDKGPKAVNIVLLAEMRPPAAVKTAAPAATAEEKNRLVFYHDAANASSCKTLEKLHAAGHQPRVVEYLTAPPPREELKALSVLLRASDQSLVRKYDPLFFELCLDDRFISENEFWGAVFEHPSLINGPIVATQNKASLCHNPNAVDLFLAALSTGWTPPVAERKALPQRILQELMTKSGETPVAAKEPAVARADRAPVSEPAKPVKISVLNKPAPKQEAKPEPAKAARPAAKAAAKPAVKKTKSAAKPVKAAKPAARKPLKKARRK